MSWLAASGRTVAAYARAATAMAIDKLAGVHPQLVEKVQRILAALQLLNCPVMVTQGVRTLAQQAALFAQGRTTPGPIVTWADGVTGKSNHQVKADGYGHAVDVAWLVNGKPSWAETAPWGLLGAMAKQQGLGWGGDWRAPKTDRPHVELL